MCEGWNSKWVMGADWGLRFVVALTGVQSGFVGSDIYMYICVYTYVGLRAE